MTNSKGIERFIKLFPWFSGFTGDLLFYIAIDTLFLTIVNNFSPAEIVSITSLSQLICIALQFPILFLIKKIGNTASIRLGAFFLLFSAVFITFGESFFLVLLGRVFHEVAICFKSASVVALENNLDLLDRRHDFVPVRTAANTVYSIITMLISFVASYMFNLHHYLPMFGCITTCAIGVMLSFFMKDFSPHNKIKYQRREKKTRVKVNYSKIVLLSIVLYALFYAIVSGAQSEGKLFIQQHVLLDFNVDQTSLIIGAIVCVSRIIRVISNMMFARLYKMYQAKMGVALPAMLGTSLGCMLFGSLIPSVIVKIVVMAIGYTIILFVRDPFKLYVQDVVFDNTDKEQHQTLLTVLEFGVKIATAGTGLIFAAILVGSPMITVIAIMFAVAFVMVLLGMVLYRAVLAGKKKKECL